MAKKLIRLGKGDLHRIIKESVNNVIKESSYAGDKYYEYEEIIENLESSYKEYSNAIRDLQEWYLNNIEGGKDMYNSYAGKYGDEAIALLRQSFNRLGSMLEVEEDY